MDRTLLGSPAMLLAAGLGLFGQSSAQSLAFDVASVKAAVDPVRQPVFCIVPCAPGERITVSGTSVDIRFASLLRLMVTAYRIKDYQLSGPDWMRSQRFDIAAKMPEGVSKDRLPEMLRTLLAERFKLSIRRESKEQPVYALVVGRNGAKLQESTAAGDAPIPESPGSRPLYTPQGDGRTLADGTFVVSDVVFGPLRGGIGPNGMKIEFLGLTMPALAEVMTPHFDRPVIDMTNLKGADHLVSESRPPAEGVPRKGESAEGGRGGADAADAGPAPDRQRDALLRAIDKAGLKLASRRAPVEMIVVDHLEKTPTAN